MFSYGILLLNIWQLVMNLAKGKVHMSGKMSSEVSIFQKERRFGPQLISFYCLLSAPLQTLSPYPLFSIMFLCCY